MSIISLPITQTSDQKFTTLLGTQAVQIRLNDLNDAGFFISIWLNGVLKISSRRVLDRTPIIHNRSFGLTGDLCFMDTQGREDPHWHDLGTRFVLLYNDQAPLK